MHDISADLRAHLQLFTTEEQLLQINQKINDIIKNINVYYNITRRYNKIQQLKKLKHNILLKL